MAVTALYRLWLLTRGSGAENGCIDMAATSLYRLWLLSRGTDYGSYCVVSILGIAASI